MSGAVAGAGHKAPVIGTAGAKMFVGHANGIVKGEGVVGTINGVGTVGVIAGITVGVTVGVTGAGIPMGTRKRAELTRAVGKLSPKRVVGQNGTMPKGSATIGKKFTGGTAKRL